jgi:hypothetical protein
MIFTEGGKHFIVADSGCRSESERPLSASEMIFK